MNFHKEVVPFIKEYMNKAFRAYDGYGACIVFYNGLSIDWDIDDNSYITKVTVESDNYKAEGISEQAFSEILSMAKILAASELEHQKARMTIDKQYVNLIKQIAKNENFTEEINNENIIK